MINNRCKTGILIAVILTSITTLGFNNKCVEEVKAIDKNTVINNQIYIDNTSKLSNFSKYKLKIDRESEFNRQIYNSEYEYISASPLCLIATKEMIFNKILALFS